MMGKALLGSALNRRQPSRPAPVEGASDHRLLERYVNDRDQDAFATLVRRHGPMVLGVCSRVLGHWQDAQDAFQVTFLVLARKADSLSKPQLLAHWLYGVAHRTALRLRARRARRQEHERRAAGMLTIDPTDGSESHDGREILAVLDEEMSHLPEKYRILLVLCYLQGKTHEEAACEAGCPLGSLSWRLARAREMLRKRLGRRGLTLSAGLFALLLSSRITHASVVSAGLAQSTAQLAVNIAAAPEAAALSPSIAALFGEVLSTFSAEERGRRTATLALVAALALLAAALLAYYVWAAGSSAERPGRGAPPGDRPGNSPAGAPA